MLLPAVNAACYPRTSPSLLPLAAAEMSAPESATATLVLTGESTGELVARRWCVEVIKGPDSGKQVQRDGGTVLIGSHPSADLILTDATVSRHHVELRLRAEGVLAVDLGSTNGIRVGGARVERALITPGGTLSLGKTELKLRPIDRKLDLSAGGLQRFGEFITSYKPLEQQLARLAWVAKSEATVLIEGETGTGKELLARAIHDHSPRATSPFVVVDCTNVSETLLESQLFGHLRGSFTGAIADQIGAFEAGNGGTVFLDELGELPIHLQPKLLRVLEARTIRRLGDLVERPIDVRFVAATNRRLEQMVARGTFRSDLYYRLSVVRAELPPLRQRHEDVATLAQSLAERFSRGRARLSPEAVATLQRYDWPGNARELRNVIERAITLADHSLIGPEDLFPERAPAPVPSYHQARDQMTAEFERRYVEALLARHPNNISAAAREAGLSRNSLYALMKRAGVTETK
jgi:transcriptional regulator with PAS, ATPase and Fis domain